MKKTNFWGIAALVAVMGILAAGCDDGSGGGDGNGGGSAVFGETLTLDAQVYWDDSYWDGGSFKETYSSFDGTRTLTAGYWHEYYNEEYDYWDSEVIPIGGSGSIANGKLSFTIGTPSYLENAADLFEQYDEVYDNFNISPSSAKAVWLELRIPNTDTRGFSRRRYISTKNSETEEAGTGEYVRYLYVDRDVTIGGKGKTDTWEDDDYYKETYTTKTFTLNLKQGWNAVYAKYDNSQTENASTGITTYNSTSSMSLSNPSNVRWVIWEEFYWEAQPTLPPANHTPLTNGQWTDGNFANNRTAHWYSFPVTAGTTYYVWWNDEYDGNGTKTADVAVDAWYSDGTRAFWNIDSGWDYPQSISPSSNGTVYVRVCPEYGIGTYSVTFTSGSTRPLAAMFAPSFSRSVSDSVLKNNRKMSKNENIGLKTFRQIMRTRLQQK